MPNIYAFRSVAYEKIRFKGFCYINLYTMSRYGVAICDPRISLKELELLWPIDVSCHIIMHFGQWFMRCLNHYQNFPFVTLK